MERRPRLLSDVLQFAEQVLVGFPLRLTNRLLAVLPTLSDGIGEPLTDFDRAGLVVLAVKGQSRARQIRIAVLPIGFVVSRHAADKEVEQERVSGVIENVQFVIRVCDNLLLVVFRFLILPKQFGEAEFLEEDAHVPDLVGESALGVAVLPLRHGLFPEPAHVVSKGCLLSRHSSTYVTPQCSTNGSTRYLRMVSGSRPRASQLTKYFSAAAASVILPATNGAPVFLAGVAPLRRLNSSSVSRCLRFRCASSASVPASIQPPLWLM